jgi:hypothetical protein
MQGHTAAYFPVDIDPEKPFRALFLKFQVPQIQPQGLEVRIVYLAYMFLGIRHSIPQIKRVGK